MSGAPKPRVVPSPSELAAFLRAIGNPLPTDASSFTRAVDQWRSWSASISAAYQVSVVRSVNQMRLASRVPLDTVRGQFGCTNDALKSYFLTLFHIECSKDPSGEWIDRKCNGFTEFEVMEMQAERDVRARGRAAKGGRAKSKKNKQKK